MPQDESLGPYFAIGDSGERCRENSQKIGQRRCCDLISLCVAGATSEASLLSTEIVWKLSKECSNERQLPVRLLDGKEWCWLAMTTSCPPSFLPSFLPDGNVLVEFRFVFLLTLLLVVPVLLLCSRSFMLGFHFSCRTSTSVWTQRSPTSRSFADCRKELVFE